MIDDSRDDELGKIRTKVMDLVHGVTIIMGVITVCMGLLRVMNGIGELRTSVANALLVAFVAGLWPLRGRIRLEIRAVVVLASISTGGSVALFLHGSSSPAGALLASVFVLAWLLLPLRWAAAVYAMELFEFLLAARQNVLHGSHLDAAMPRINRSVAMWIVMGACYLLVGGIVLAAVRVLVGQLREKLRKLHASETAERVANARLEGILAGIHDVVFLHDPEDGRILEVYGRFAEVFGLSETRILSMSIGEISAGTRPWSFEEAMDWMRRCTVDGPQTFSWKSRRADGGLFWTEVSMRTLDLDGSSRILVTMRNVDESMRTQLELADLNADLERRVLLRTEDIRREREALETFSYTVSHDLRAPLRAIDGFARVVQEDFGPNLPQGAIALIDRIVECAGRMGRLIEALLSLSRWGRNEVDWRDVDVAGVVRETIDELTAGSDFKNSGSETGFVSWEVGDLPVVRSDPDMVRRVFANLLGNACKFTGDVAEPKVRVISSRLSDGIWFEVSDNGIGFDMDRSERLFKPFERLHGDAVEGIGIGLATVKKILDHLGGEIHAEGHVGAGASFRFRLGPAAEQGSGSEPQLRA